jgi:predicted Zn-dependent peptidase
VRSLYDGTSSITLGNGLRVLVEEVPSSRSVSAGVWIGGGSREDPERQPGLAHAIEHLLFKGTVSRSARRIAAEIEQVGGHINAATGRESTLVYAEAPAESLETLLAVLADVVRHPAFAPDEIERERGVLIEEIRNHEDDPEQCAHDLFARGLWDPPHPLGRPVLGTRAAVARLTREIVAEQHRRQYTPGNLVVVVCGAVRSDAAAAVIDAHFAEDGDAPSPMASVPPVMRRGSRIYRRRAAQSHLYVALPGPAAGDPDRFALELVNAILGDGLSSRLFQRVREELGLAYAVSSAVSRYRDAGVWTLYAGVDPRNAPLVQQLLLDELRALLEHGVADEELACAASRIRGHVLLSLESNGNRMIRLGSAATSGIEIVSPEAVLERFDAVTMEDVERVVQRFIDPDAIHCARIGPSPRRIARRRRAR